MHAHTCGYQPRLQVLLQRMIKSYEMGSLIEVSLPCFVDVFPLLDLDYCQGAG